MHDSFPHALELSKRGYNAFAVIYRPGWQTAYEDLARALTFIFENAEELGVNTNGYSLWAAALAEEWQPNSALTARRITAERTFQNLQR